MLTQLVVSCLRFCSAQGGNHIKLGVSLGKLGSQHLCFQPDTHGESCPNTTASPTLLTQGFTLGIRPMLACFQGTRCVLVFSSGMENTITMEALCLWWLHPDFAILGRQQAWCWRKRFCMSPHCRRHNGGWYQKEMETTPETAVAVPPTHIHHISTLNSGLSSSGVMACWAHLLLGGQAPL